MHEDCRNHVATNFHKIETAAAKAFLEDVPEDVQVQSFRQNIIEENKQKFSASHMICLLEEKKRMKGSWKRNSCWVLGKNNYLSACVSVMKATGKSEKNSQVL